MIIFKTKASSKISFADIMPHRVINRRHNLTIYEVRTFLGIPAGHSQISKASIDVPDDVHKRHASVLLRHDVKGDIDSFKKVCFDLCNTRMVYIGTADTINVYLSQENCKNMIYWPFHSVQKC